MEETSEKQGFAFIVTKWINVGAGLTPQDPRWLCHLKTIDALRPPSSLRNIRAGFESQVGLSVQELTADKESNLFSTREERLFHRAGKDGLVWERDCIGGR